MRERGMATEKDLSECIEEPSGRTSKPAQLSTLTYAKEQVAQPPFVISVVGQFITVRFGLVPIEKEMI